MGTPYLGEIRIFSFNFPPKGWQFCNGQLLPINQNQALFSILGTTYGGDGRTNFALPNLQGKVAMSFGNGHVQGEQGGSQGVTLVTTQLPAHTHTVNCNKMAGTTTDATGAFPAYDGDYPVYSGSGNAAMAPTAINGTGGDQPHNNMAPYLVVSVCIALQGIFPSRN